MKRGIAFLPILLSAPAVAQVNARDLETGTRIPRLADTAYYAELTDERRATAQTIFGECMFDAEPRAALEFIERTDYGVEGSKDSGVSQADLARTFKLSRCLGKISARVGKLRTSYSAVRGLLLEQAYFSRFPNGPTWLEASSQMASRELPLSADNAGVESALAFADCVVAAKPAESDLMLRTARGSEKERAIISQLQPLMNSCLPIGHELKLTPSNLRSLLAEGLWHASGIGDGIGEDDA